MIFSIFTHPGRGPPLSRSNTWYGFSSFRKLEISSEPWHPPDLTFTNTRRGCTPGGTILGSMFGSSITETDHSQSYTFPSTFRQIQGFRYIKFQFYHPIKVWNLGSHSERTKEIESVWKWNGSKVGEVTRNRKRHIKGFILCLTSGWLTHCI